MESVSEDSRGGKFKSKAALSEVGKPQPPRFQVNQAKDEDEDMKVEMGDNKAIEKSMRSGFTTQPKGLGGPKSSAAYSKVQGRADQTKRS